MRVLFFAFCSFSTGGAPAALGLAWLNTFVSTRLSATIFTASSITPLSSAWPPAGSGGGGGGSFPEPFVWCFDDDAAPASAAPCTAAAPMPPTP